MPNLIYWQTCIIWWTDGHAWIDGQTDMPGFMDWQTHLNWWTNGHAGFDGLRDKPDWMDWKTGLIWWKDMPYMMDWRICLIWWTDGHVWFEGLMNHHCYRHFCCCCFCCCCCCFWRSVVAVVVIAIDYNRICILWLGDFLHSYFYLKTKGLWVFNKHSSYLLWQTIMWLTLCHVSYILFFMRWYMSLLLSPCPVIGNFLFQKPKLICWLVDLCPEIPLCQGFC